jgi:hypothetical protein
VVGRESVVLLSFLNESMAALAVDFRLAVTAGGFLGAMLDVVEVMHV